MDSQSWLTVVALLLSVASVVVTGLFSVRTQRLSHELEREREQRAEEQSAIKAAERVYEPLAQAAAELQSRIFNIVETGWIGMQKRY
jgi:cytochrome b